MGFSLYYEARRQTQITKRERMDCYKIVEQYCAQYPFQSKTEDFGVYGQAQEAEIIFSGATKLPYRGPQFMYDVANYWLKCLTEITTILADCQWTATFEGVELILDGAEGWRFPTDDEFNQRKAAVGGV